jgi:hypothetical protein
LTNYDTVELSYPGIGQDKVVNGDVALVGAQLSFFVNGKYAVTVIHTNNPVAVDLTSGGPVRILTPNLFSVLSEAIH